LSSSVPKRQKTHLAVFEVVKQDVETLALDAILLHHDARTSDNFTWVALPINLAQPGPSTKDLSISDLDQVNFVLGTESLDELVREDARAAGEDVHAVVVRGGDLVLALQDGVHSFAALGKGSQGARFVSDGLVRQLPKPPTVYGIGGLREKWTPNVQVFVESLEKRKLSLRYGGSFVGDYNQVLTKGGFFAYPELTDAPEGKYRLQFESNPVGFITEKAGGRASTGTENILDVEPSSIVQRVPTYLGDQDLVREFESIYQSKSQTA